MKLKNYLTSLAIALLASTLIVGCSEDTSGSSSSSDERVTQLKIQLTTTEANTPFSLEFSSIVSSIINWGDDTMNWTVTSTMSNGYAEAGTYTIVVKGKETSPTATIADITYVEEIFLPL